MFKSWIRFIYLFTYMDHTGSCPVINKADSCTQVNYIDLEILHSIYQFFLYVGLMCSPLYLSAQTTLGVAWFGTNINKAGLCAQ